MPKDLIEINARIETITKLLGNTPNPLVEVVEGLEDELYKLRQARFDYYD